MKKITLLFLFSFLFFFKTYSQKYHSKIEKEVFTSFKLDSVNISFIKSMCAIDSTLTDAHLSSYINRIDAIIGTIPEKESKEKKEKKRIKLIYNTFHDYFFRKYENSAYFTDIFSRGTYNCVTATALYTYVFDELKIPYHVKEAPSHVYLIAYPNTYKIYLETTVPGAYGFIVPKDSEIKKIVDELVGMKLVSNRELATKGYDTVYNDYFYGKEYIDKNSLIGMQYFNKCIDNFENEDFDSAQNNIAKSLVFHETPMSKLLFKELIALNIENLEFNTEINVQALYNYLQSLEYKKDFDSNDLKHYLYKLSRNDDNNIDFIENAAKKLTTFDDQRVNDFSKEFLYEYLTRKEMDELNYDSAMRFGDIVLEVNPNSKIIKEIITFAIGKKIDLMIPSEESISLINEYYTTYSFLENNKRIESVRALHYGQFVILSFGNKNIIKAEKYLSLFGELLDTKKEYILLKPSFYSTVYLISGRYYYGRNKFKKAKTIFSKGLEFNPENNELQKMLKWSIEDMN